MLMNGTETRRWDDYTNRKISHADPTRLSRDSWMIIYGDKDYENANKCFEEMQKASKAFGMKVEEPYWCEVDNNFARKGGKGFCEHL